MKQSGPGIKKKICLVIHSLQAGGMERVMSELASNFAAKSDIELYLVLYGKKREIFYSIPDNIIVEKPSFKFNEDIRLLSTIKTVVYLRKTLKRINPDSILSFGEFWNNFVLLATLGTKLPVFVSDRSQPDKSLGRFQDFLRRRLYPTAKGLILQTEKAKSIYLKSNRHNNIEVIGNPINEFPIQSINRDREKIVLMVGRLIKSKNQDKLIEVFANVNNPDWKLILVGYDHLKQNNMDRLKQLAKDLSIDNRVVFAGKQNNVGEFYKRASIFAFTSSSEGFPNVIGEAMSAGLPVVSYDCVAGPSDLIQDGQNGFLVPIFDQESFEEKLSLLMKNEGLRLNLGRNAKNSIQRFSKEKICDAFYEFIT